MFFGKKERGCSVQTNEWYNRTYMNKVILLTQGNRKQKKVFLDVPFRTKKLLKPIACSGKIMFYLISI